MVIIPNCSSEYSVVQNFLYFWISFLSSMFFSYGISIHLWISIHCVCFWGQKQNSVVWKETNLAKKHLVVLALGIGVCKTVVVGLGIWSFFFHSELNCTMFLYEVGGGVLHRLCCSQESDSRRLWMEAGFGKLKWLVIQNIISSLQRSFHFFCFLCYWCIHLSSPFSCVWW